MEINRYVYHPTDNTSVDLYVEFNEDEQVCYYKVIRIWDATGNDTIEKSNYDLSWLNCDYITENGASA